MIETLWLGATRNKRCLRRPRYHNEADLGDGCHNMPRSKSHAHYCSQFGSGKVRIVRMSYLAEMGYPHPTNFGILTTVPPTTQQLQL